MLSNKKNNKYPINLLIVQLWIYIIACFLRDNNFLKANIAMNTGFALSIGGPLLYYLIRMLTDKKRIKDNDAID